MEELFRVNTIRYVWQCFGGPFYGLQGLIDGGHQGLLFSGVLIIRERLDSVIMLRLFLFPSPFFLRSALVVCMRDLGQSSLYVLNTLAYLGVCAA